MSNSLAFLAGIAIGVIAGMVLLTLYILAAVQVIRREKYQLSNQ